MPPTTRRSPKMNNILARIEPIIDPFTRSINPPSEIAIIAIMISSIS